MSDGSKGTYTLIGKNDNFPDGKLEYDFNNINGFSAQKVTKFLQGSGYIPAVTMNDTSYNACLFALAAKQDMGAVLSLGLADVNAMAFLAIGFFGSGLGAVSESTTQAEDTEK